MTESKTETRRPVPEAPLVDSGSGLAPAADGWFVVNVRDAQWLTTQGGEKRPSSSDCSFERGKRKWLRGVSSGHGWSGYGALIRCIARACLGRSRLVTLPRCCPSRAGRSDSLRGLVSCLREGEPGRVRVLRLLLITARRGAASHTRGAQGRQRAVLRPGRVHGEGGATRSRGRPGRPRPIPLALAHRARAPRGHCREVHRRPARSARGGRDRDQRRAAQRPMADSMRGSSSSYSPSAVVKCS
jgi:hypothetical protein